MKYDKSKSFPYPVLREHCADYIDGAFEAQILLDIPPINTGQVQVNVQFTIREDSIKRLIKQKKAKFILLVESRKTYFRDLITTFDEKTKTKLYSGGQIRGPIVLSPYVVADQNIDKFSSKNFNPEYSDVAFNIEKGDVLALQEPAEYKVEPEMFDPIGTVFEVIVDKGLKAGELQVNLESEKVQIVVNNELKKVIDEIKNKKKNENFLLPGIIIPVLMYVLQEGMIRDSHYQSKRWYRAIQPKCDNMNIDIDDGNLDLLSAAQKLLHYPLKNLGGK